MNVIDCLQERGFIDAITSEELREKLKQPTKVYIGFDPTADSLHLGSLMGIVALRWFQKFGHTPVAVLGGATGRIGDPSGKSTERPLLDEKTLESNVKSIARHFEKMLDRSAANSVVLFNNYEWFSNYSFIDFLRDVGKHFRVNIMLTKDSVRSRINSEEGISFTEFSYQVLQAYDFYHLYTNHGVILQMGGSDQWGNITAGIELIRKLTGNQAFGLTHPLLTRSDGKKFGKSEEGAIWLAEERCSPYQFYQYLVRVSDADVIKMLKLLTFLSLDEIHQLEAEMQSKDYVPNSVQKRFAEEVTRFVHGEEGVKTALKVTQGAAPGATTTLDVESLEQIASDMPHQVYAKNEVVGQKYVDIAVKVGLASSKGETTRLIQNGGAYLNNEKIEDIGYRFLEKDLIGGRFLLLSFGKKKKFLISIQ